MRSKLGIQGGANPLGSATHEVHLVDKLVEGIGGKEVDGGGEHGADGQGDTEPLVGGDVGRGLVCVLDELGNVGVDVDLVWMGVAHMPHGERELTESGVAVLQGTDVDDRRCDGLSGVLALVVQCDLGLCAPLALWPRLARL